jgi:serine/threonine protein kinase
LIGVKGQALVTDFGMSKMLAVGGFTTSAAPGGSVPWMAPELFPKTEDCDGAVHSAASDIWSLGMTILV